MSPTNQTVEQKLTEIFEGTVSGDDFYEHDFSNLDFYSIMYKAVRLEKMKKIMGVECTMHKTQYEKQDSIFMLFCSPLNNKSDQVISKTASKRIVEIVSNCEKCFGVLDKVHVQEVESDKYLYIMIIKKI